MITENICCNCRFYEGVKGAHGCAPCKEKREMTKWDDSCEKLWLIPQRLTIVKPTGKDRCVDCANFVAGDPCHICEFIHKSKPITNADRIRAMTDEELAEWFGKIQYDTAYFCAGEDKQKYPYPVGWLDWLRQEVKEDE